LRPGPATPVINRPTTSHAPD